MTTLDLAYIAGLARAAKSLADRATPGPWKSGQRKLRNRPPIDDHPGYQTIALTVPGHGVFANPAGGTYPSFDQDFIAAARTDVPELAGHVMDLVEMVQKLADGLLRRQDKIRAPRIDGDHPAGMDAADAALTAIDDLSAEPDKMRGLPAMPELEWRDGCLFLGRLFTGMVSGDDDCWYGYITSPEEIEWALEVAECMPEAEARDAVEAAVKERLGWK